LTAPRAAKFALLSTRQPRGVRPHRLGQCARVLWRSGERVLRGCRSAASRRPAYSRSNWSRRRMKNRRMTIASSSTDATVTAVPTSKGCSLSRDCTATPSKPSCAWKRACRPPGWWSGRETDPAHRRRQITPRALDRKSGAGLQCYRTTEPGSFRSEIELTAELEDACFE
jgi:hypothetical protein